jgi:Rod binding domain-containing protein
MIDNITSTATAAAMTPAPDKSADVAKIHSTAQQFEALLIGELLKTSREAGSSGWLGTGDNDEAGQIGMEVGEQEFARMLAASGGLGLSKTIEAGMRQDAAKERT